MVRLGLRGPLTVDEINQIIKVADAVLWLMPKRLA
jgi:hypothetical protein